jgi:hypothetical protein
MSSLPTWLAVITTVAMLLIYEMAQVFMGRRNPVVVARTAHARLREQWFEAVSRQPGSEILAVQALRNSLMSATVMASTAVLGLIGTVTLAAPSLHVAFGEATTGIPQLTPRMTLELVLMALLFASLVASAMAIRYYNHATFISAIPVGSPERQQWLSTGIAYVRRAGVLYSWALRHLILVAPVLASLLHPYAGPPASAAVVAMLYAFDRFEQR